MPDRSGLVAVVAEASADDLGRVREAILVENRRGTISSPHRTLGSTYSLVPKRHQKEIGDHGRSLQPDAGRWHGWGNGLWNGRRNGRWMEDDDGR